MRSKQTSRPSWLTGREKLYRPNIILLTIDTLRSDRLGCYGYKPTITPNIDRLAKKSVRFEQAITGGSWTQAAFPVILTSTNASMYGGCLGPLSPARPMPIQNLRELGYRTAGFSTSPLLSRNYGYQQGFDHFVDLIPEEKDPSLRRIKGGHFLLKQPITHSLAKLFGIRTRPAKLYVSAEQLTREVCRWINDNPSPFFVWAHYMDVHWPYHLEERLISPGDIAQAWRDVVHLHNANWNGAVITSAQREHYIRLYEEAVAYTDQQLGVLFDFLENSGLEENTSIIVLADHGEEFQEHGRWGHWEDNLHEEIIKVPLLIKPPGLIRRHVVDEQVRLLDIMPTILDLCECPLPENMLGSSLKPLWEAENSENLCRVAISEMWRDTWHIIAVRSEGYKLIWDSKQPDAYRLYDLMHDPKETAPLEVGDEGVISSLQSHIHKTLELMENTRHAVSTPYLDEAMISRLRDLGYLQ